MRNLLVFFIYFHIVVLFAQDSIDIQIQGQEAAHITIEEKDSQSLFLRVLDDSARAVENITIDMVKIRKSDEDARVLSFSPLKTVEEVNQKIVLVLDNSGSMHDDLDVLLSSIENFLSNLGKASEVSVILFDESIDAKSTNAVTLNGKFVKLRQLAFTNDFATLMEYCRKKITLSLTHSTYLNDAVLLGLTTMRAQPAELQKSIVILSDGDDNGSTFSLSDVLHSIPGIDTKVYAVDFSRGRGAHKSLAQMIQAADGRLFEAKRPDELIVFFTEISKQITTIYLVTYKLPSPPFGSIAYKGDSLHIETQTIMDESPLLNYVFFDSASSELQTNYFRFNSPGETAEFDETTITQILC